MVAVEELIQEVVRRIVETAHPRQIILFGSATRGELGPDSDLDVLVIASQNVHQRRTAQAIHRNLIGLGFAVDVLVATPDDIARNAVEPYPVLQEALRDGRVIYAT